MTKKVLKGIVSSAKNNKTIVVEVTRKFKHQTQRDCNALHYSIYTYILQIKYPKINGPSVFSLLVT